MTDGAPFATRTVWWLIVVGALSFAGAAIFTMLDDRVRSAGADTFSVSAIGHRALVKTLERLDVPVIASRYRSAEKARSGTGFASKTFPMNRPKTTTCCSREDCPRRKGRPKPSNWLAEPGAACSLRE